MVISDPEEDINQYFIAIEQTLIMQTQNLVSAIFFVVAAHYIFNMNYHPKLKDLMTFLQVKMAGLKDERHKWGAVVGTHVNGLSRQYALLDQELQNVENSEDE